MHRGQNDDHLNGGGAFAIAGVGHNRVGGRPLQWQTPHRDATTSVETDHHHGDPDLDLVEAAFVEGFAGAGDPTSFLRLAQVPFEAIGADGARLSLLRIEVEAATDVASLTPHLGGTTFRYDPLPASMISRRQRLRFVYFDGTQLRSLDWAQVRRLAAA